MKELRDLATSTGRTNALECPAAVTPLPGFGDAGAGSTPALA